MDNNNNMNVGPQLHTTALEVYDQHGAQAKTREILTSLYFAKQNQLEGYYIANPIFLVSEANSLGGAKFTEVQGGLNSGAGFTSDGTISSLGAGSVRAGMKRKYNGSTTYQRISTLADVRFRDNSIDFFTLLYDHTIQSDNEKV